jgi:hypothetical protein
VYTFALVLGLGVTLGLVWVAWSSPEKRVLNNLDAGLWTLCGALVGGRAVFVLLSWPYFEAYPLAIPQVWLGGFSGPGALAGGLLALVLVSLVTRQPLGQMADTLLPLAITVVVSTWLACWQTGCAYGYPANSDWGLTARDEWGQYTSRIPVQFLGASVALLVAWFMDQLPGKGKAIGEVSTETSFRPARFSRPGTAAGTWLLVVLLTFTGLTFLRADPVPYWQGFRLDTLAGVGLSMIVILALLVDLLRGVLSRRIVDENRPV